MEHQIYTCLSLSLCVCPQNAQNLMKNSKNIQKIMSLHTMCGLWVPWYTSVADASVQYVCSLSGLKPKVLLGETDNEVCYDVAGEQVAGACPWFEYIYTCSMPAGAHWGVTAGQWVAGAISLRSFMVVFSVAVNVVICPSPIQRTSALRAPCARFAAATCKPKKGINPPEARLRHNWNEEDHVDGCGTQTLENRRKRFETQTHAVTWWPMGLRPPTYMKRTGAGPHGVRPWSPHTSFVWLNACGIGSDVYRQCLLLREEKTWTPVRQMHKAQGQQSQVFCTDAPRSAASLPRSASSCRPCPSTVLFGRVDHSCLEMAACF